MRLGRIRCQTGWCEDQFDDVPGSDHGQVEHPADPHGHFPPVVFAVDVEDRQDQQVREDERYNPAEADAAGPQHHR